MRNKNNRWFVVIDNVNQTDEELEEYLSSLPGVVRYCYKRYTHVISKKSHFDIYIEFEKGKWLTTMMGYFPSCYLRKAEGPAENCIRYVLKKF